MLRRLKFGNFKAWEHVDLELGMVTGLFGTNSAGKSSLLQFLLLLKQTRDATDRALVLNFGDSLDLVNLGAFKEAVHQHALGEAISWTLDWRVLEKISLKSGLKFRRFPASDSIRMECEIGLVDERLQTHSLEYGLGGAVFKIWRENANAVSLEIRDGDVTVISGQSNIGKFISNKTYMFPDQVKRRFQKIDSLGRFELEFEKLMDSIYYLGPLRDYPQREYRWSGSSPSDVGRRGERVIEAILAATRNGEKRRLGFRRQLLPFQEVIAKRLQDLGLVFDFGLREIREGTGLYETMLKTTEFSVPTALTDVGFGVSQVLPALVLLYYVPQGSVVLMEQPEIHLHPAAQSGLADIMLEVATSRKVQIIVETHSEHLMRRLRAASGGRESAIKLGKIIFGFRRPREGEGHGFSVE